MRKKRAATAGAIVALIAVGLYTVCCKPAWSPSGDKVAYISIQEDVPIAALGDGSLVTKEAWAVAVYDVAAKTTEVIAREFDQDDVLVPVEVLWPYCDRRLAYVSTPWEEKAAGTARLTWYDLKKGVATGWKDITAPGVFGGSSLMPMLMDRPGRVWMAGDEECLAVDFRKEEVSQLEHAQRVMSCKRKLYFISECGEDEFVFGRVKTLFGIKEEVLFRVSTKVFSDVVPLTAMPRGRALFGFLGQRQDEALRLMLYDVKGRALADIGLPKEVSPDEDWGWGAEWAPDGSTLWLSGETEDSDGNDLSAIAEISIPDGGARVITLTKSQSDDLPGCLHLALSPGGKHLAASVEMGGGYGLALVDLTTDERTVTIVPQPDLAP